MPIGDRLEWFVGQFTPSLSIFTLLTVFIIAFKLKCIHFRKYCRHFVGYKGTNIGYIFNQFCLKIWFLYEYFVYKNWYIQRNTNSKQYSRTVWWSRRFTKIEEKKTAFILQRLCLINVSHLRRLFHFIAYRTVIYINS